MAKSRDDEEKEILYRLDERTERMDGRMDWMQREIGANSDLLDEHDNRIQRNTTFLNAITFSAGSLFTALIAKLQGLIHF